MLEHGIYPAGKFLEKFSKKFEIATHYISKKFPFWDINYLVEYKDHPASVYKKFDSLDCYVSIVSEDEKILAFSMTYGYEDKTCILGARSFAIEKTGYEALALTSMYNIPMQMIQQSSKYEIGITTFNLNPYTDRLWKLYCRMLDSGWNKHKKSVNSIFKDYNYQKAVPQSDTKIINFTEQRYSLVEL
jgi:hypothetical protein